MYDVIIVGGGVAGLAAGIYATRYNLKVLVVSKDMGGLLKLAYVVENYPGLGRSNGLDIMTKMEEHAREIGVEIIEDDVDGVGKEDGYFIVKTSKDSYKSNTIVLATGSERRKLGVPGEDRFRNKGVGYCATCDAPLMKNKIVGVVGGSDSAVVEALLLAEYAKKVCIIYRGEKVRPEPINGKRMLAMKNIEIIPFTNVLEIRGDKMMNRVVLDKPYNGNKELKLDGIYIEVGIVPNNALAKKLGVELDKDGYIIIDKASRTNVAGVFAAGDVTNSGWKQAIIAAAQGSYAANSVYNYLGEKKS